jgi:hypothetical protein
MIKTTISAQESGVMSFPESLLRWDTPHQADAAFHPARLLLLPRMPGTAGYHTKHVPNKS